MIACLFVCLFACLCIGCLFGWLLACYHHHHRHHSAAAGPYDSKSYYHCIHSAATGQSLHAQLEIMRMMLIVVIITIVRSHLGSSVRVACEGRLLTNDVRGFTNRDVDCNMVSRVLFRGHLIPYFADDWEGQ